MLEDNVLNVVLVDIVVVVIVDVVVVVVVVFVVVGSVFIGSGSDVILDILGPPGPAFQYSTCWVFQGLCVCVFAYL